MNQMTEYQAKRLAAKFADSEYVAKRIKHTIHWGIWCVPSDAWVECDPKDIEAVTWSD